ncbi:hypothetical protein ACE6H2_023137 [Prunus campanulata]
MAALLVGLSFVMGPGQMRKLYGGLKFGSAFIKQEWSYLRGGLATLHRDYGLINNIHPDIGTHVIHHLFP